MRKWSLGKPGARYRRRYRADQAGAEFRPVLCRRAAAQLRVVFYHLLHQHCRELSVVKQSLSHRHTARGRGIALMRGLMQDVTINPDTAGTTVHLCARIT